MITWNVLVDATLFVASLTVITVTASTSHRIWSKLIARRRKAQMHRAREFVVGITELGFDEQAPKPMFSLREWKLIDDLSVNFISKMTGEVQDFLVEMLESHGARQRAIRRLRRPGSLGRSRAAHMLGALNPDVDSVTALIASLGDSNSEVREIAAESLGKLGAPDAVVPLLKSLVSKRRVPAGIVVDSLIRIGPVSSRSLRIALRSSQAEIRAMAVEVLGALDSAEAIDEITDLLANETSEDNITRIATALGRIESKRAAVVLLSLLSYDIGFRAKSAVIWALGQIRYTDAVDALQELVRTGEFDVARTAAESLAKLGDRGRDALVAIYEANGTGYVHAAEVLARAGWLSEEVANEDSPSTTNNEGTD